ncbi:MAG TPA: GSU2403 family nucleotidyltransferase fold protein [Candidatus Desulfobacillus sp.]|nr:GSU2403 family nucleotidyltransferase fold protein [Candidatus Desulfobacillus sp.]
MAAYRHAQDYAYGMRWKRVRGAEYLFRQRDRRGNGKLLGRRSAETEKTLERFIEGKILAQERLAGLDAQLAEQARLNKALRLARVPRVVARILRLLEERNLLSVFSVLGTQALYAYEAGVGVQFLLELPASGDIDLLYDTRWQLTLTSTRLDGEGLLGLLKKADRSFEPVRKRGFRAANAGQFMVDLILAPRSMRDSEPVTFSEDDLVASEVPGLQWLINAPKLDTVAIDEDGFPAPIRAPDPRAFALHKAWLSRQPERDPVKKPRDLAQARAVVQLVREAMPHLSFDEAMISLHGDARAMRKLLGV